MLFFQQKMSLLFLTSPPPPPSSLPLRATEIPRGGGWVKKEASSEGGGVAYRGFFFSRGSFTSLQNKYYCCIYHLLPTVGQIPFFSAYAMVFFYTIVIGSWINFWLSSSHIIAKYYVSHKNIVQHLFSRGYQTNLKNYGNYRGGVGGGMTSTLRNGNAGGWGSKEKCHP